MGKLVKILLGALAVLIVVIVVAAIALPMVIDPNDYKPQITAAVKDKTGRDLSIDGDLELSVFPWIGVDIGKIALSNAPGFGTQNFAEIEQAKVKVKLLPLISKKIEISQVVLKGLSLNLAKNPKGIANWDDLAKSGEQQPETQPEPETESQEPPKESGAPALAGLAVGGVAIEDAKIQWDDQQAGKKIEVEKFDFHMDELTFDEPFDFDMGVQVSLNEPELTEQMTLSGSAIINEKLNAFQLNSINLDSHSEGKAIPGNTMDAKLVGAIAADLEKQTLNLSGIKLSAQDLVVTTDLNGTQIIDAPKINGPLTIAPFSPRALMQKLGMKVPETKDPKALNALSASLNVNATDNSVGLRDIVIKLDETNINGQASVIDLKKSALRFQFDIDKMNIDRYLPPPAEKGSEKKQQTAKTPPASPPPTKETSEATELPMETLRALDVKGTVGIAELIASGLTMKGINLTIDGKNGIVKSDQLIQSLYQGKFKGDLNLDARGAKPKIALNEDVKGVQVEPLLKDATGKAALAGSVNLDAKLTAVGATADAIKSSLNGNVNALFTDGAIIGFSLIKYIRSAKSAIKTLKGEAVVTASEEDRTEFSEMKMTSVVNNGVVNNQELSAKSPLLRVNGSGLIDLPQDKLDYKLVTKIVGSLKGQGGGDLEEMKGVPIALKIAGSTQEPKISLDLENMLMESQKAKIDEKKKELTDKVNKKLDKQLEKFAPGKKDMLKKLF